MRKIVLTSCGIIDENLQKKVLNFFDKKPEEIRLLYIPVAADVEDGDKNWINEEFESILNLGIKKENILEYRMDYDLDLNNFDAIYVLGGNTFYLLKKIRDNNFDIKLKSAIDNGCIYIGSSAGSIIMGNTIKTACDENIYIEENFTGLKYVNGIIIPHANKREDYIKKQQQKFKDKIYSIYDEHAIILLDEKIKEI